MPKTKFKMDKGLARMRLAIDPKKMDTTVRKHLRRAAGINGKLAEKEARRVIQSGRGLAKNADLTIALKGEDAPLKGTAGADLFNSITSKVINDTTVFAGVLRTDKGYNIAKVVHEGATIPVTSRMRGMFFYLFKASIGDIDPSELTGRAAELWEQHPGPWYPLKDSTTAIVIPSRPFMELAFKATGLKKKVEKNWVMALQAAMRERAGT